MSISAGPDRKILISRHERTDKPGGDEKPDGLDTREVFIDSEVLGEGD